MTDKREVPQGTLALMVLKTLETMGPLHGYGIARRIEQTSGGRLALNYGTVYPALMKLEQEGFIASEWGTSENNRKAKYYRLTRTGRGQLKKVERQWEETTAILSRFLKPGGASVMRSLSRVLARLAGWFGRSRREREWAAEIEAHLRLHIEDNLRSGMSEEEARREALVKFGGFEATKESMRDTATFAWLETTWRDVRYAFRSLRRSPGFAATAILSLALGLGASMAVFTIADNLLVRPLPYRESSQLVMLWESGTKRGLGYDVISPANYFDWKAQNDVLSGMAALREYSSVLLDGDRVEEFGKQSVTADFFPVLGVQPWRGRLFTAQEDRSGPSYDAPLLISYRLWQSSFGGNEDVIGRKVQLDSLPRTIIGVLPPAFYFLNRDIDLWEPLGLNPAADYHVNRARWLSCIGRLRPSVGIAQARTQMAAIAARLEAAYPEFNKNITVELEPLRDAMFREVKTSLLVLLAAVAMMLAVACANVANLLLARYSVRRREMAVRASIGASRWRVIRQLLTESIVLGLAGGICGIAIARWAVAGLLVLAPASLRAAAGTQSAQIHVDSRILLVAFALSMLTGILFGLAPAIVTSRFDLIGALRCDNRSGIGAGGRLRAWLVGSEVAVSVVLLAGAMLLFRSLVGLETVPSGLDPSNLLTFRVSLPLARYPKVQQRSQFFRSAIEQIEQLPGMLSVTAVNHPPFSGHGTGTYVNIAGLRPSKPGEELLALVRTVMPGYFGTLRIPFLSGRDFTASDNVETAPRGVIVNEAFVRQFLRGKQPLGTKINLYLMEPENTFSEIIGVVDNLREWSIERAPMPTVYHVFSHMKAASMIFLVRTERGPLSLSEPARRIVQRLDPAQPIADVRTMEDILGENFARQRFSAWLLSGFAAVALALAAVGIYGVLAYSVTARTRELGVRAALGAAPGSIVALVLKTGARPVAGGLVVGIVGALTLGGLLSSLLFGIGPRDPLTFIVVPSILAAVALIAASVPAFRAGRVDPMDALRTE